MRSIRSSLGRVCSLGRVFGRPSRFARAEPETRSLPNAPPFGGGCQRFGGAFTQAGPSSRAEPFSQAEPETRSLPNAPPFGGGCQRFGGAFSQAGPETRSLPSAPVVLGCLLALLVAGCPEAPQGPRYRGAGHEGRRAGGTVVTYHESTVDTLDPHIGWNELATMAVRLCMDGLLDYDTEAQLVPSLAVAMPTVSADGKTFAFQLRPGVRFHATEALPGGRELVAEDVAWSIRRLLHPDTGSPGFSFFTKIVGAQAFHDGERDDIPGLRVTGEYTVEFELTEPDQTFLNAMAMPFAYPQAHEHFDHWGDDAGKHCTGVGPYVLERWERGVQLEYRRNDGYWGPHTRPDRLIFMENLDRRVASLRFRNGEVGAIHRQNTADFVFYSEAEAWAPYRNSKPISNIWGLVMNTELAPFDDVHVRRAVAFAIDREGWSRARGGRLTPNGQLIPATLPGHVRNLDGAHHLDLDRAREEMRLAGHPDGLDEEVTLLLGEGDVGRIYGELIQSDLARIGIQVKLRPLSFAAYLQESGTRRRSQMTFAGWNMDFPDPANFYEPLLHSDSITEERSMNKAFYSNPELDRILDDARAETDRAARAALYERAAAIVVADAPWAFIFSDMKMELWQPYVRGYEPHPVWSQDYRDIWLDLPRERIR